MKAVLFAGADIGDYTFCHAYLQDADIIICCDGGVRHTKALGIQPQYIVGDFGSAPCASSRISVIRPSMAVIL